MRIGEIFALPARTCINYELNGNPIRQVDRPACNADVVSTRHDARGRHVGHVVRTKTGAEVLVIERREPDEDWTGETLWSDRRTGGWSWGCPDPSDRQTVPGTLLARSAVLESLRGRTNLKDEVGVTSRFARSCTPTAFSGTGRLSARFCKGVMKRVCPGRTASSRGLTKSKVCGNRRLPLFSGLACGFEQTVR